MNKILKITISLIVILLLTALLLYLAVFGYFSYWSAYVKCGGRPVTAIDTRGFGRDKPNRYERKIEYSPLRPPMFAQGYYCTEQEAIDAGLEPLFKADGTYNP